MRPSSRPRLAFSIIELLIVIAILGVLMALLLVAVQKVRAASSSLKCKSNLHQMGVALVSYSDGNGGQLMPVSTWDWSLPTGPDNQALFWFGEVIEWDGGPTPGQIDLQNGLLMPYMENNAAVQRCPDFSNGLFALRFQGATSGYGYNYVYLGPGPGMGGPISYRITDVASTSKTVAFADSARINYWSYPEPVLEENYYIDPPSNQYPTVHFRHMGKANVLFLDGHVEVMPPVSNALNMDPPWGWSTAAADLRQQAQVFDLGASDDLYDRN